MTFADLIADVKQAVRETTTEKDAFLLSSAARKYRMLLQSDDWPQQRSVQQLASIVSGTQAYDLPADFDRFAGDRVNYTPVSGAYFNACSIPIIRKGSARGDTVASVWEGITPTISPCLWPRVVGIQAGGANGYQLVIYPIAGNTGDTIAYDYYSVPARSEITTATVISVGQLYETLFNMVAADYSRFIDDANGFQVFSAEAKAAHRLARQTLSRL